MGLRMAAKIPSSSAVSADASPLAHVPSSSFPGSWNAAGDDQTLQRLQLVEGRRVSIPFDRARFPDKQRAVMTRAKSIDHRRRRAMVNHRHAVGKAQHDRRSQGRKRSNAPASCRRA